jgi:RNA polymerase sigma factor (TIGR02999 family)
MNAEAESVTGLLSQIRRGNRSAFDRLFPLVYAELRRVARKRLAQSRTSPLSTTSLVHETYLKLTGSAQSPWEDRAHFFAVAATAMRQILVDDARRRMAGKRGGGAIRVDMSLADVATDDRLAEIIEIDEALSRLGLLSLRLARVVELRFFAGLSTEEIAEVEGMDPRTVKHDWRKARAFLFHELYDEMV